MVEALPKHSSSGCGITSINRWPSRVIRPSVGTDNERVPLSALLYVHNGLFRAGLIITGFIVVWSAFLYLRKQTPSGSFRATLVLTEGLFVVQGLIGIEM